MDTPICDFVNNYIDGNGLRVHMPGHKGVPLLGIEKYDITEIDGADVLYHANGIIKKSEENSSLLFGTALTIYSTEGSSLSIRAMLYLAMLYAKFNRQKPFILAARNVHRVFVSAIALLDLDVEWLICDNQDNIVSCNITAQMLENTIFNMTVKPTAVYITTPDYLGNILDVRGIAEVCHKYGILLLVDNAHGSYLNFLENNIHPISLGADICTDSAHKTLPALTGGGYIHISKTAPNFFINKDLIENAMSMFASTSPSYLILQSLDMTNKYLADNYKQKLSNFINLVDDLKLALRQNGYTLIGNEPLKLTISAKSYGYTGTSIAEILLKQNITCEFYDVDYIVMMLSTSHTTDEINRLKDVLLKIERKAPIISTAPVLYKPKRKMSIRQASFAHSKIIDVENSLGKILATTTVSCPPAVPILVCGEVIDQNAINLFNYYGIEKCVVVDEDFI